VPPELDGRDPAPRPDDRPAIAAAPGARSIAWAPHHTPRQQGGPDQSGPDGDPGYCQVLARSLIRAQLALSLVCLAFALAVTASYPVLCAVLPGLVADRLFGLPLTLLVLGAGIFPVILAIGWFYTWQAGRLERRFITLMDRVSGDVGGD
jgi:hypothetical protein